MFSSAIAIARSTTFSMCVGAALGRAVAGPQVRRFLREDVGEVAAALDAQRRERRDVDGARPLVAMLDQQPASAVAAFGADERPGAFQLHAVELQLQVALLQRRGHVVDQRLPGALVPQHHDAGAVAVGDDAFECAVLDGMILDVHRQPLVRRIDGRAFGHGPRQQDAVVLEAQVVVQMAGQVLLDAEKERRPAFFGAFGSAPGGSGDTAKFRLARYSLRAIRCR